MVGGTYTQFKTFIRYNLIILFNYFLFIIFLYEFPDILNFEIVLKKVIIFNKPIASSSFFNPNNCCLTLNHMKQKA